MDTKQAELNTITKHAIDNILDCMSGSDGGLKFFRFMLAIRQLDESAKNGDMASEEIINIVTRFSRLIDILGCERE